MTAARKKEEPVPSFEEERIAGEIHRRIRHLPGATQARVIMEVIATLWPEAEVVINLNPQPEVALEGDTDGP